MSGWLDMAAAIQTRLESLALMEGIPVVIDRQLNINSTVTKAVGKASGACVTILWNGAAVQVDSEPLVSFPSYQVRLYTRPIIRDGDEAAVKADDLVEAILCALHDWHPDAQAHSDSHLKTSGEVDMLPSASFLIYEITFTGRVTLPSPQFTT